MKRDMELVRKILMACEEDEHAIIAGSFQFDEYDDETVGYHNYLLVQAGLVEGSQTTALGDSSPSAIIHCLTWKGHEFIEAARDEGRWAKAKKLIQEKAGSATFDVVFGVLTSMIKGAVGIA